MSLLLLDFYYLQHHDYKRAIHYFCLQLCSIILAILMIGVLLFYINDIGFKVFQIMGRNICDLCFYIVFDSR